MENVEQKNESNGHVIIRGIDGETIFNVRRMIRDITNDGMTKSGTAIVNEKSYNVFWDSGEYKWIGPMYAQGLGL